MSRPELHREFDPLSGVAAVALFGVLGLAFWNVDPAFWGGGFGGDASLTRSIGAALFNIDPAAVTSGGAGVGGEGFLVAFEIIDMVIVAALVGAIMLARREDDGVAATDGGLPRGRHAGTDEIADQTARDGSKRTQRHGRESPDGGESA